MRPRPTVAAAVATVAALLIAGLVTVALARPRAPLPHVRAPAKKTTPPVTKPAAPQPPAAAIDIRIIQRGGDMTQLFTRDNSLDFQLTTTSLHQTRTLTPAERQQLSRAVRSAVQAGPGRRVCMGPQETYVSVTVDEKTVTDALCDKDFSGDLPYREVLNLTRALVLPGVPLHVPDGGTDGGGGPK